MKIKKLAGALGLGFIVYMGLVLTSVTPVKAQTPNQRYTKVSIDNTPLFVYTDTTTHCKFIYDSITRVIRVAKGSESCPVPDSLEN